MWLLNQPGTNVFVRFGHSPDTDLVAEIDGGLVRVQVKTSTVLINNGRYQVSLDARWQSQLERTRQALQLVAL